jgi:hypothetical protein
LPCVAVGTRLAKHVFDRCGVLMDQLSYPNSHHQVPQIARVA